MTPAGRQQGGVALLVALLLLVLMASAALATTRTVMREWAILGADLGRARAQLAAESGLAWAATRFGQPLGDAPSVAGAGSADEGPFMLDGDQEAAIQVGFQVHRRCLGRVPRGELRPDPGSPDPPLDVLWECHAHGACRVGPPGPSAVTYRQVCHGWFLVSASGPNPLPVRRTAWSCDAVPFCDTFVTRSW